MIHRVKVETDDVNAHPFGPVLLIKHVAQSLKARRSAKSIHIIEHDGVQVDVDKSFVDDCVNDGDLELARYYRDGQHIVLIYHWLN